MRGRYSHRPRCSSCITPGQRALPGESSTRWPSSRGCAFSRYGGSAVAGVTPRLPSSSKVVADCCFGSSLAQGKGRSILARTHTLIAHAVSSSEPATNFPFMRTSLRSDRRLTSGFGVSRTRLADRAATSQKAIRTRTLIGFAPILSTPRPQPTRNLSSNPTCTRPASRYFPLLATITLVALNTIEIAKQ